MTLDTKRLYQERIVVTSEFGDIHVKGATFGNVKSAFAKASEGHELDSGRRFSLYLLSKQVFLPRLSVKQIAGLGAESMSALVECACSLSGVERQYQFFLNDIDDPLERMYQAHKCMMDNMAGGLKQLVQDSLAPLSSFATTIRQMAEPHKHLQIGNIAKSIALPNQEVNAPPRNAIEKLFQSSQLYHSPIQAPDVIDGYRYDSQRSVRMRDAYAIIYTFERNLRCFIEVTLSRFYGADWWNKGVPKGIRDRCEEEKNKDKNRSRKDFHPLQYSQIGQCLEIIVRGDNWNNIYQPIFHQKDRVQTCFGWILEARNPVSHSRQLTPSEYDRLRTSSGWLAEKMGNSFPD